MTNLIYHVYNGQHAHCTMILIKCAYVAQLYNNVSWIRTPDPMPFCLHKRVNDIMESTEISKEWLTLVVEHIGKHKRALGNSNEHENRHSSCVSLLTLSMPSLSYKANQSLWTERLTEVNSSRHQNNCLENLSFECK